MSPSQFDGSYLKNKMKDSKDVILYKPQSQKECDEVVKLILKSREDN